MACVTWRNAAPPLTSCPAIATQPAESQLGSCVHAYLNPVFLVVPEENHPDLLLRTGGISRGGCTKLHPPCPLATVMQRCLGCWLLLTGALGEPGAASVRDTCHVTSGLSGFGRERVQHDGCMQVHPRSWTPASWPTHALEPSGICLRHRQEQEGPATKGKFLEAP